MQSDPRCVFAKASECLGGEYSGCRVVDLKLWVENLGFRVRDLGYSKHDTFTYTPKVCKMIALNP